MDETGVKEKNHFGSVNDKFIHQISSLRDSLPLLRVVLNTANKNAKHKLDKFVETNNITVERNEKEKRVTYTKIDRELLLEFEKYLKETQNTRSALSILPRSFIVSLISQYDAFLGSMIKEIFIIKPEILNSSDKNLNFSQIIKYNSIEDVREYIIEKELDTILRKSHSEHFDWLENKLNLKLRENLSIWPTFIEITERRNLFAHNDGIVNSQYLSICKEHKVKQEDANQGEMLSVSGRYFTEAYRCVFEIGTKLIHVIWRKIDENDRARADSHLNNIIYDLLVRDDYELAITLSEFATNTIKKYSSEEFRLVFLINKAQAYKWHGDETKCIDTVNSIDWGAYGYIYKLCNSVILDDFKEAIVMMKNIGDNPEIIKKSDYRNWPLFKTFRESNEFLETFHEIYKEKFDKTEQVDDLDELQKEIASTKES